MPPLRSDLFFLLLVAVMLCGCSENPSAIQPEEYRVYQALLNLSGDTESPSRIVIYDSTKTLLDLGKHVVATVSHEWGLDLPTSLVDDYRQKNEQGCVLEDRLKVSSEYTLIGKDEHEIMFRDSGGSWAQFYERFPDAAGLVRLSRVGFNTERDLALPSYSYYRESLDGATYLLLFKKNGVEWQAYKRTRIAVS